MKMIGTIRGRSARWTWLVLIFATGCRTLNPSARPLDTTNATGRAQPLRVPIYTAELIYFGGDGPSADRRTVDRVVQLPALTDYLAAVTLDLTLSCPRDGCDPWDRAGYLALVDVPGESGLASGGPGLTAEAPSVLEVLRFITPYGVGGHWSLDVTSLRPLLGGQRTFRLFIDTWVGPASQGGSGWQVDATLTYRYGARPPPEPTPIAVYPLWTAHNVNYGDPAIALGDQLPTRRVRIPDTARRVEIRALVTGHGQGNADNCAEFCAREHRIVVDGDAFTRTLWRADCESNPINNQKGTWQQARAGWCPGMLVEPWVTDVTSATAWGLDVEIRYDVEAYTNTCRPDSPACAGCVLGTTCTYDGGRHSAPFYRVSAVLIVYQ